MRLIDAKAFDLRVSQRSMTELFPNWKELPEAVKDMLCKHGQYLHMLLETQPTVDAVEVVRCKNCTHGITDEEEPGMCQCVESAEYDSETGIWLGFVEYHTPDFFCAYGERRSDD